MWIEFGRQGPFPTIVVLALQLGSWHRLTTIVTVVAVIMTFAGHGAFAIGCWTTPVVLYGMSTKILAVDHKTSERIVFAAVALDCAVCFALLFTLSRRPAALYAASW